MLNRASARQQIAQQAPAAESDDSFSSQEIAAKLLDQIRDGLQARNSRKMLAPFDPQRMPGYALFKDQVEAFFAQYDSFRVYIRLVNTSFQQDRAVVTASFQLDAVPRYNTVAVRREDELTFELARADQGWKIIDVRPRSFFSP